MNDTGDVAPGQTVCRVTAAFGRRLEIATAAKTTVSARIRGKRLRVVCGDRVLATPLPGETDWLVDARLERKTELARTDSRGCREILAANVDAMLIVIAILPKVDPFVVDRFLAGARIEGIDTAIAVNKTDIGTPDVSLLEPYHALGVPVIGVSALSGAGCEQITDWLGRRLGVLVGQSGVGKSSLVNRLAPGAELETAELGQKGVEGRHTTVASRLLGLARGGELIDSPGVRDFAPHIDEPRQVAHGFAEIDTAADGCRFNDCLHRSEPGCEVQRRLESGRIADRRYTSYRRLLTITEQLGRSHR